MKDEQLERAKHIKSELAILNEHKSQVEFALKNSRDQSEFKSDYNGYSQIEIGWSCNNSRNIFLKQSFAPIDDTSYLTIYLSKLNAHIQILETEFQNL